MIPCLVGFLHVMSCLDFRPPIHCQQRFLNYEVVGVKHFNPLPCRIASPGARHFLASQSTVQIMYVDADPSMALFIPGKCLGLSYESIDS